jgi:pimeloyl-ACP methyl ester carboxylesterase
MGVLRTTSNRIISIMVLLLFPVVDIIAAAGGFLSFHGGGSRRSLFSPPSSLEDLVAAGTIRTRRRRTIWTQPVSPSPPRSSRGWRRPRGGSSSTLCRGVVRDGATASSSNIDATTERRFYDFDGVTCSYEYLCNSATTTTKKKQKKVLLLIHPVGIGMANWFWDKFLEEIRMAATASTTDNNDDDVIDDVYAINLIGCGRSRQSGVVDDEYFLARTSDLGKKKNRPTAAEQPPHMQLLPWTRQCAYFCDEIIKASDDDCTSTTSTEITVISQGGLAPVGLQLAASRPIVNVILASPPTLQELRTSLNVDEAVRNWDWLRNLPDWAFRNLLETKGAIQFFSNLFLFDRPCDRFWIDRARTECDPSVRAAVRYFNAGMCDVPSVNVVGGGGGANMTSAPPRVLVVRGAGDRRMEKDDFAVIETNTRRVTITVIPNANKVVPWEAPGAFLAAVRSFLQRGDHDDDEATTTTTAA